jgi:DNA polymerase
MAPEPIRENPAEILGQIRRHLEALRDAGCREIYLERPFTMPKSNEEHLADLEKKVSACEKCQLHKGRTQTVFGAGNPSARLLFVGEAPGAEEDRQGIPFVGRAGQLLTKIIEAMGMTRDDVYICNVLKCRPPGNRDPEMDEIICCEPYLLRQLDLIRPEVMVALGRIAIQTLLREKTAISRMRGRWYDYHGIPLMPTFHPAYLLRNPAEKGKVWDDMKEVLRKLHLEVPKRSKK